ncbi:MAG: hypothetical protein HQM04_07465 [Magnetococcales bacterium]|nr:hypothetical protein [Magnetococcales bacterium]
MTHPEGVAARATRKSRKTSWHRLLAQVVTEPLTSAKISVQTEIDVTSASPKADIVLLRREGNTWTKGQKELLADGMRDTNARELLIEFKFTESLTGWILGQLLVYDHLYLEKQQLKRSELKSVLLLSKTPNTDILEKHGFSPTDKVGVYVSDLSAFDSIYVILLNALPDAPHNALWKCFASRRQEWQKAFARISQHSLPKRSIEHECTVLGIRKIRMEGMMKNVEPMRLTPEYVMDLGRQELFASMMNAMSDEELLKLQRPANIRQKGELKGRQEGKAETLTRQLQYRFGNLPSWATEKVSNAKPAMLEEWSLRILDAPTLESVFADPS